MYALACLLLGSYICKHGVHYVSRYKHVGLDVVLYWESDHSHLIVGTLMLTTVVPFVINELVGNSLPTIINHQLSNYP